MYRYLAPFLLSAALSRGAPLFRSGRRVGCAQDLESTDRSLTPWLVAMMHCPWYNSNLAHQGERQAETAMRAMEPLLYQHKAAVVITGHVHGGWSAMRAWFYLLGVLPLDRSWRNVCQWEGGLPANVLACVCGDKADLCFWCNILEIRFGCVVHSRSLACIVRTRRDPRCLCAHLCSGWSTILRVCC